MIKTLVKINPMGIRSRNWKTLDLALMALRKIAFVKKVKVEVVVGIYICFLLLFHGLFLQVLPYLPSCLWLLQAKRENKSVDGCPILLDRSNLT